MQLSKQQEDWIYDFLRKELRFMPECGPEFHSLPFAISKPFSVYDISKMSEDQVELLYELAPQAIQNCLKPGYMIYAVDWQHHTVLYDPLDPHTAQSSYPRSPSFTRSGLCYYNGFYPDGDYYFFIDRFGTFGYLSHPWRREIWIFGASLVEEFKKIEKDLGLIKLAELQL